MAMRIELEDSAETINDYLYKGGMTDGLPVVPPTEARVEAMVRASGLQAGDALGEVPPLNNPATVEQLAINAVMAGCEPRYMPALMATVEALLDPVFGAHSVQTTTNPVSPMILFNGPICRELDINCGAGCFGPGRKANATIGRALRLIMLNIGGAVPGDIDKAPLGWPGKYNSCCFGENEEDSPWEPYHVEHGFSREDSTVTLIPVNGMWPITETSPDAAMVLHHVTHGMATTGHSALDYVPEPFQLVLVMSPVIARMVAEITPKKQALKQHLFDHARIPLDWYPPSRHEDTRRYLAKHNLRVQDNLIPIAQNPEGFIILVAGGSGGLQSCGLSTILGHAVTRKIQSSPITAQKEDR